MTGLTKEEEKKILSAADKITAGVELMVETPLHFIKCILMKHEKAALEVMKELHERAEKAEAELAEAKRENEEARDIHNSNMNRYAERAEAAVSRKLERELIAAAERVRVLEAALQKIEQRAYNEEPAEELEDCQRDLRHIHAIACQALESAK